MLLTNDPEESYGKEVYGIPLIGDGSEEFYDDYLFISTGFSIDGFSEVPGYATEAQPHTLSFLE